MSCNAVIAHQPFRERVFMLHCTLEVGHVTDHEVAFRDITVTWPLLPPPAMRARGKGRDPRGEMLPDPLTDAQRAAIRDALHQALERRTTPA